METAYTPGSLEIASWRKSPMQFKQIVTSSQNNKLRFLCSTYMWPRNFLCTSLWKTWSNQKSVLNTDPSGETNFLQLSLTPAAQRRAEFEPYDERHLVEQKSLILTAQATQPAGWVVWAVKTGGFCSARHHLSQGSTPALHWAAGVRETCME